MSFWGSLGLIAAFLFVIGIYGYFQRRRAMRQIWATYRLVVQTLRKQIADFSNEIDSTATVEEGNGMFNLGMLNGLRRSYEAIKALGGFGKYLKTSDLDLESEEVASTEEQFREIRHQIADKAKGQQDP